MSMMPYICTHTRTHACMVGIWRPAHIATCMLCTPLMLVNKHRAYTRTHTHKGSMMSHKGELPELCYDYNLYTQPETPRDRAFSYASTHVLVHACCKSSVSLYDCEYACVSVCLCVCACVCARAARQVNTLTGEVMLYIASMLRLGDSPSLPVPLDDDSRDRMLVCLSVLAKPDEDTVKVRLCSVLVPHRHCHV